MSGYRPWKDIRGDADRDPERRCRVEAARREAEEEQRAYEQSLAELRRARAYTQEQLAAVLDVPQSQVSRLERQADLYVSTLARYLEAMGGHLELVGVFDGHRVPLALGDLTRPIMGGAPAQDADPDAARDALMDRDIAVPTVGEDAVIGKRGAGIEEVRVHKDVVAEQA